MRQLDLADLVALAAEVSEVEAPKLLELLDTPAMAALLAPARPARPPHEVAAVVLVGIVALAPLPAGNRRLALLAALHVLAVNGLDADLDPEATRSMLARLARADPDAGPVAAWLDPLLTARDPLDGALRDLLAPDAWRAIGLALLRASRHGRRLATPGDLLLGLFREGTGPAALALGSEGHATEAVAVPPRPHVPHRLPAFEPDARRVLACALCSSVALGHREITGGHLLLGLLDAGHQAVLPEGVDAQQLRREVIERLGPGAQEDDLTGRLRRLAARLRTTDPEAAAELEEVVDLQGIGLDRLVEMVRAWRGDVFLEALGRDDAARRVLGASRLGAPGEAVLDDRLLATYLADIERYPVLSRAEEAKLATAMATADEREAAAMRRRLIESNLRLVPPLARTLRAPGLSLLDLIQEGNLGLLRAAERFDPAKGYRFATFATWHIRDAITTAIRKG